MRAPSNDLLHSSSINNIKINNDKLFFRNKYFAEIRYIVPWAQYDDNLVIDELDSFPINNIYGKNKNLSIPKNISEKSLL